MKQTSIDVIALRGKFTEDKETGDMMVQEYTGDILLLQHTPVVSGIQESTDSYNLTGYIEKFISESTEVDHITINYVMSQNLTDTFNTLSIMEQWTSEDTVGIIGNIPARKSSTTIYLIEKDSDSIHKSINKSLKRLDDSGYGYVEIYVYYK